jgi:hypothetical protein
MDPLFSLSLRRQTELRLALMVLKVLPMIGPRIIRR